MSSGLDEDRCPNTQDMGSSALFWQSKGVSLTKSMVELPIGDNFTKFTIDV